MNSHFGPELESLLLLQERFDCMYEMWSRRNAGRLCDLSYANAYDGPDPAVITAIKQALESTRSRDLQYTPYGGSTTTRRLIADRLRETHAEPFSWRDVILTPGAMAALNVVFRALKTGGRDEVVVLTPCWMDYPLYLVQLGLIPVLVPLNRETFRLDFDAIDHALNADTRALVFSQPANPTGIVYGDDELLRLAQLLRRRYPGSSEPPVIISDECHREIVYSPDPPVSPSRHYDSTIIVYSFGKALLMQGQRIGYVAIAPRLRHRDDFQRAAERNCRMMGFCSPTALMQLAVQKLLAYRPDLARFAGRRDRIIRGLRTCGYKVVDSQASFFVYVTSPEPDDFEFAKRLAIQGVIVTPGSLFHDPGHFRISITASDDMIDRALPVFESARKLSNSFAAQQSKVSATLQTVGQHGSD
jgi:aspartate aminotransferase